MLKNIRAGFALLLLALVSSCDSTSSDGRYKTADQEIIDAQTDPATQAAIDSVAKASRPGDITFPVPDTLTALLQKNRPNAKLAPFPDQVLTNKQHQTKNPLYITGDFDGDKTRDYAVQVLDQDSIHVLAFLNYAGAAREIRVATYAAKKLDQGYYTQFQLKLAPKDSTVIDYKTNKPKPLRTDGVSVIGEDRTAMYLLQGNRFLPVQQHK